MIKSRYKKDWLLIILLGLFYSSLPSHAQTLTLYSFPPPHPIRWKSPHSLLVSTIRNFYSRTVDTPVRQLGHIVVELRKDSSCLLTGIVADELSGMKRSILDEKLGLGILFTMVNGHLESTEKVSHELNRRIRYSRVAFMRFEITDSAYQYLKLYLDSFCIKQYDKRYNGLNRPRAGRGSGCSAFGISFLELIQAMNPFFHDQWSIHVRVPEKLIGEVETGKKVSLWRIFFRFHWLKRGEAGRELELFEPQLIYDWINREWENASRIPWIQPWKPVTAGNSRGLELNYRLGKCLVPMFESP
ncbi:MAG: hypothetical protein IPP31_10925 [Chitinophagaceae bacterium]|nr:hypothetical protein [Chitinophagaceae bacterium]